MQSKTSVIRGEQELSLNRYVCIETGADNGTQEDLATERYGQPADTRG